MYFAVFATDRDGMQAVREATRPKHREYLRNPAGHPVKVRLGGPTLDEASEQMNGTMLVVEADSIDAVRVFLLDDPYAKVGLYAAVEVRPWVWGLGNPDGPEPINAVGENLHPYAPASGTSLCAVDDIPDGGGYECGFGPDHDRFLILLLRRGQQVWGYVNRCPHFSIPLSYEPGVLWTYDSEIVMCAHHSAMFRFEDGVCFDGPCAGQHLMRVPVVVKGGWVVFRP